MRSYSEMGAFMCERDFAVDISGAQDVTEHDVQQIYTYILMGTFFFFLHSNNKKAFGDVQN